MNEYIKREAAAERVAFELMYEASIAMGLSYKELIELEAKKQERIKLHIQKWLEQAPSADVVEVVHGHWEWEDDLICSECGCGMVVGGGAYNYCPNCGAKMDGEEQENEYID